MKELIERFPLQVKEALEIGKSVRLTKPAKSFRQVLITGLGGSGIGGTILAEMTSRQASVPVGVNKDYFIPGFVGPETLVIASSYSGNTEETLQAMEEARQKKAHIVCVTSGGKMAEEARQHGFDLIEIPGGMPPRSCLGYSLTQLFVVMTHYGLIPGNFLSDLEKIPGFLERHQPAICNKASELAVFLDGKIPVVYAGSGSEGVAVRFRQQLNENSKMLCWHHVLPEMNHNELVGWAGGNENMAVVVFRNDTDFERTQKRMEVGEEIITRSTPHYRNVWSEGETAMEKAFYVIHLGDWTSLYLGENRGVDVVEVKVIDHLKSSLATL